MPAAELTAAVQHLQTVLAAQGVGKAGHAAAVVYFDGPAGVSFSDHQPLQPLLERLRCGGRLEAHAFSTVGYARERLTAEKAGGDTRRDGRRQLGRT